VAYSPVYSAAFIQFTPSTPNNAFYVPDGYTAVLRYASATQDIGAYNWSLSIQDSIDAPTLVIYQATDIGENQTSTWAGRVVLPAPGIITTDLSSVGDAVSIYVGGYLLKNVID